MLTVAHLDDNPGVNDPERLLALCQACHLAYDTRIHRRNREVTVRGDLYEMFPKDQGETDV